MKSIEDYQKFASMVGVAAEASRTETKEQLVERLDKALAFLQSRLTKRAVDVKPAPLILCPDCNLYHDKTKTRCTIPASRN